MVADLEHTGVIEELNELRWDIRPSPSWGTIEVRTFDGIPTAREIASLAALTQCLVEFLSRELDAGRDVSRLQPWFVRENKWRAARYGVSGRLVHPEQRELAPVADVLGDLVERVRPALEDAGDTDLVRDGVRRVLAAGGSARQRAAHERTGSVDGVVDDLLERTRSSWEGS